jgi:hypothetical protein
VGILGVFLLRKYCFSAYIGIFQLQRDVRILYEPVDFLTARMQKSSSYGWRAAGSTVRETIRPSSYGWRAAGSTVRETIRREPLELKQACFVTELLRAGDETESGFRQVFVFRGPL